MSLAEILLEVLRMSDRSDFIPNDQQRIDLCRRLKLAAAVFTQNTGVAVVTFPSAIASLTWAGGASVALVAYLLSLYTLGLMLQLSNIKGQRAQSFRHLVYAVFGTASYNIPLRYIGSRMRSRARADSLNIGSR